MNDQTARLCQLLDEVEGLCAELDELSRRQGAELDAGRPREAAAVVAARASVVARLDTASRALGSDPRTLERLLEGAPASTAERARRQATEISAVVARVLARDEEDRALFAQERDRVCQELGALGRGRSAIDAYQSAPAPDPTMQDRRG